MKFLRTLFSIALLAGVCPPAAAAAMTRGPYLQHGNANAITICWRTDTEGTGMVRFGATAGALVSQTVETTPVRNHFVRLIGLTPATTYYYSVETDGEVQATGSEFFFRTPPEEGGAESVRFWVMGDCGTAGTAVRAVRDAFTPLHAQRRADLVLLLGDNAYGSGTDVQYQAAIFDVFAQYMREVPFWSCLGNHETYAGAEFNGKFAYENIFSFPVAGECGGVASGTERYFSWNHGRVHFISLDSMTASRAVNGTMAQWLTADLQANLQPWVVAFWHHPPYTRGSHNSDTEGPLVEMRQNILPILENHGVDLVLCGHSHSYERSYLLNGHYGLSGDINASHRKNSGTGREDGPTGPYYKAGAGMTPNQGAVYVVAGSSGWTSGGLLNHPAHFVSLNRLGSLVVDVNDTRMDVKFLREVTAGEGPVFDDYFSIIKGTPPPVPVVTRGPYLQKANPTEMTIRWRTATPASGGIRYGTAPGALTSLASEPPVPVTEHSLRLTGLTPDAKYWYAIDGNGQPLVSGPDFFFTTPPPVGDKKPVRVWVLGNAGTQSDEQRKVRDSFRSVHAVRPADLWLMLGDNAYGSGLDSEYQGAVFDMYGGFLQQLPLWSCIGNHETYGGAGPDGKFAYERIFDFPAAGECGGVASGTERYYSWDYANIHFIALDSETSSRLAGGPMAQWLATDLASNTQTWTIVCFHHPPYTKGTHDSDREEEHIEMRENIIPILEQHGVDLVLGGHSHVYERSHFLKDHSGDSTTFSLAHKLDGGGGRLSGNGAYKKYKGPKSDQTGTVYVVAGSSGQRGSGELNHPAHFVSLAETGSVIIDVSDQQMDALFLREQQNPEDPPLYQDTFTIQKGLTRPAQVPAGLSVLPLDAAHAALHWEDSSPWEDGYKILLSINGGHFSIIGTVPPDTTGFICTGLTAGGSYAFKVQAYNSGGEADSAPYEWTHSPAALPVSSIGIWRFIHWGAADAAGVRADAENPDGDGLANLIEYALGTSPRDAFHAPGFSITASPGGAVFQFQRIAAADLTYTVEVSPTMAAGSWVPAFTSSGSANTTGPVSVPITTAAGRQFTRLRVTLNP